MSKELIERLRKGFGTAAGRATQVSFYHMWSQKAADAIESLLAENERLNAECYEWEANSKQWEQEYYKKDTELAKYRDAPVVAYLYLDTNGEECFGHPDGYWPEKYSKPLIVKPDENQ